MPMEVKRLAGAQGSHRYWTLTWGRHTPTQFPGYRPRNRVGTWATVNCVDPPFYADRHGSPFHPEQEAQLSQIASHAGTDTERLVDCRREFVSASMGEFPDARRRI